MYHGKNENRDAYMMSAPLSPPPTSTRAQISPLPLLSTASSFGPFPPDSLDSDDGITLFTSDASNRIQHSKSSYASPFIMSNDSDGKTATSAIPDTLKQNFRDQMSALLDQNSQLTRANLSLKSNRGVKIDEDEYRKWEKRFNLQAEQIRIEKERYGSLEGDHKNFKVIIVELEDNLRKSNEKVKALEREVSKLKSSHDSSLQSPPPISPRMKKAVIDVTCQTKHVGAIPDKSPKAKSIPIMTSIGTITNPPTSTMESSCQTDPLPEPTIVVQSPRQVPKATAQELDAYMILHEITIIRSILETTSAKDNVQSDAWEEMQMQRSGNGDDDSTRNVVGLLSGLKQRAVSFKSELDLLRRQQGNGSGLKVKPSLLKVRTDGSIDKEKEKDRENEKEKDKDREKEKKRIYGISGDQQVVVAAAPFTTFDFGVSAQQQQQQQAGRRAGGSMNNDKRLPLVGRGSDVYKAVNGNGIGSNGGNTNTKTVGMFPTRPTGEGGERRGSIKRVSF